MRYFFFDTWPGVVILVVGCLILGIILWFDAKGNKAWMDFAIEHKCQVVDKDRVWTGKTYVTRYAWLCDDGVTYWK